MSAILHSPIIYPNPFKQMIKGARNKFLFLNPNASNKTGKVFENLNEMYKMRTLKQFLKCSRLDTLLQWRSASCYLSNILPLKTKENATSEVLRICFGMVIRR